jgi:hypothetical protein
MQPLHCLFDPRSHHRRCGLDPTAVSPAPPFSQVFAFDRSRERRARDGFKDAEVPSKRRDTPLGLLSCGCLENDVAIHMGIIRSHYDRSFLPIRPGGSFAYAFADRRQPANPSIGPALFHQRVELFAREVLQQLMKNAIVMAHGIDPPLVSGSFPNNPGPVGSMACAMYSKNVPDSRAAMPSVVVELAYDRKGSAKAWCG